MRELSRIKSKTVWPPLQTDRPRVEGGLTLFYLIVSENISKVSVKTGKSELLGHIRYRQAKNMMPWFPRQTAHKAFE